MSPAANPADALLERIGEGQRPGVVLVAGDLVLSEPAGQRVATALAEQAGCGVTVHRRPATLAPVLEDLRTFSLFEPAKVIFVLETALMADQAAAADLVDQAAEAIPVSEGDELTGKEREAASRLLQALRLFGVQADGGTPEQVLSQMPDWVYFGGAAFRKKRKNRPRGKKQAADLRAGLVDLLVRAIEAELLGYAEGDLAELGTLVRDGLPEGHSLVLAESSIADKHPLVEALRAEGLLIQVGNLEFDRRGQVDGLDKLAAELARTTGKSMRPDAVRELARRTLRKSNERGRRDQMDAESSGRFAAEYRKLAGMVDGEAIDLGTVQGSVEDRGEEDVWKVLDDIGAGNVGAAMHRLRRLLESAEDEMGAKLSTFSLLAEFARQLVAVQGLLVATGAPAGQRNYNQFKSQIAPTLQADLEGGLPNPLGRLHPYRLHRVYLAASRHRRDLTPLLSRLLETELALKGESGAAQTSLLALVAELGASGAGPGLR